MIRIQFSVSDYAHSLTKVSQVYTFQIFSSFQYLVYFMFFRSSITQPFIVFCYLRKLCILAIIQIEKELECF